MKTLSLIILSIISIYANAQKITGKITDSESGKPVPFAEVSVIGNNLGTVSDIHGNFVMDVSNSCETCIIRFSSLGYEKINIEMKNFTKNIMKQKSINIKLPPKSYQIPEVDIYGQRSKLAQLNSIKRNK